MQRANNNSNERCDMRSVYRLVFFVGLNQFFEIVKVGENLVSMFRVFF